MPFVEYKMGGGLNLKAAPTDIADDELTVAEGCRFDVNGAVSSERGNTRIVRPARTELKGIIDQYIGDTLSHLVKNGAKVREVNGPAVTDTLANFTGGGNITGATYRSHTYLCDGSKIKRWDGTTLEAVGLDAPTAAPTVTAQNKPTNGNLQPGTYKYWVTFYNGVAESNFSPVSDAVTVASPNNSVKLSNIPTGGATVTKRRIYRTDINGSVRYFLDEISNDSADDIYNDNAELPEGADEEATPGEDPTDAKSEVDEITDREVTRFPPNGSLRDKFKDEIRTSESGEGSERTQLIMTQLGALGDWTDHTPPPDDLAHLTFVREQFFGISDNTVMFSRVGNPEYWPVLNSFRPGRRAAETVMNIMPLDRDMIIFTDSGLYRLSSLGASFQPSTVRLDQLDSPTGLASEWGVCDLLHGGHGVLLYYGKDGLYITDGRASKEISFKIEEMFTNPFHPDYVDPNRADTVRMVSSRDRVWMSYNGGERTLMIDFQAPDDPKFSVLSYGYTALTRDKKEGRIRGGTKGGWFVELNTSGRNEDLGAIGAGYIPGLEEVGQSTKIDWRVRTKAFRLTQSAMTSAHVHEVILDINTGGHSTKVSVQLDTGKTVNFIVKSSVREQIRVNLPTWMRGQFVSVELKSRGENPRHLYGVGFNIDPEGAP